MNKNGTTMGQGTNTGGSNLDERLDHIKESVKGLVDKGEERVAAVKSRVLEVKDQAMSKGNVYVERTNEFIKANPLKAVGIAFGLGYIGMRLFRR